MAYAPSKNRNRRGLIWPALLSTALLGACTSGLGGSDYERTGVGIPAESRNGTVLSVRQVKIEGTETGLGAGTGCHRLTVSRAGQSRCAPNGCAGMVRGDWGLRVTDSPPAWWSAGPEA